jgi:serine O-acetyltransferase
MWWVPKARGRGHGAVSFMELSLTTPQLAAYTTAQLNTFFPDDCPVRVPDLALLLPGVLERLEVCFSGLRGAHFHRGGLPSFDHLNGDQYSMFLYLVSSEAHRAGDRQMAVKSYLLNKALHGIEVFYEVELPPVFWFSHAVGTVLGRASYGNGLLVAQGCTVGNKDGKYPTLGEKVVLLANSSLIGDCRIGSRVCIGAGSQLIEETVPDDSTVVGSTPNVRILPKRWSLLKGYFAPELPAKAEGGAR